MAKIKIYSGVTLDYSDDGWPEFKKWLDGTYASLRYTWVDEGAAYQVAAPDGQITRICSFNKDSDASADFEDGWDVSEVLLETNRDGRQIVQPVTLGKGQWHYWHGEGDDVVADPQTVGGGQGFEASCDAAEDCVVEWSYRDPVWIAGGSLRFQGALMGDNVSFVIYAPATPITANGGGTGNCNLVGAVIVPAMGDGAYDVDLSMANPVPTADAPPYTGYWEHELTANLKGRGTTTPSATPGQAKYHLLAVDYDLDRFVNGERLLGSGENYYEPQNINVSLCLPGWEFKCTLHNATGGHTVEAVWRVLVSRYWTTT